MGAGWGASGAVYTGINDGKKYTFSACETKAEGIFLTKFACGVSLLGGVVVYQEASWNGVKWYTNDCP